MSKTAVQTIEYTVKKGDTLKKIANKYGTTDDKIAELNDIKDKNLIYIGQVLTITGKKINTGSPNAGKNVKITAFGLQSTSSTTLFVTWSWSKKNTKEYQVIWYYTTGAVYTSGSNKGKTIWYEGSNSTTTIKQSTYSIPQNAIKVKVKVKAIAKTRVVNKKDTPYWTSGWSEPKNSFLTSSISPDAPSSAPTVTISGNTLTASLDNLTMDADQIVFQVIKDDSATVFGTGTANIITGSASYSWNVDNNSKYKVRCYALRTKDNTSSDWTPYSENKSTFPSAPSKKPTLQAQSKTDTEQSVLVSWDGVFSASSYTIEYTTNKDYFDSSGGEVTSIGDITDTKKLVIITSDKFGAQYFFRVKAHNDAGDSSWSDINSIIIGTTPSAPTTWSSVVTAIAGEKVILYWVHNSEDNSKQTNAAITLYVDGVKQPTITPSIPKDDTVGYYELDTSRYPGVNKIEWEVQTSGITNVLSVPSTRRKIDIYAKPTLELGISDLSGELIDVVKSFPFTINAIAGPNSQTPIGYHVTIVSDEVYETVDEIGNFKMVNAGEELYSEFFNVNTNLEIVLTPGNINLENGIHYTIKCSVTMNSGLTAEETYGFSVSWIDEVHFINAEVSIDSETLTATIRPYCVMYESKYFKVTHNEETDNYVVTTEELSLDYVNTLDGKSIDKLSTTKDIVYVSTNPAITEDVYFIKSDVEVEIMVEDVMLSVYRREFDGTFTKLIENLNNTDNTYFQDPHPSLDYARYRIVATTKSTGAISYNDIPGIPVGESAVIIQWSEQWSEFDVSNTDEQVQPPWAGSLLRLPYNIDVSDNSDADKTLVEYIGRKHPVSYYGTQLGETATWNVEIDKSDKDTLYALRRLKKWMGDVYVREPSGSGYWASISVSFSQKHCVLTIPVTLNITRVEGGL